MTTYREVFEQLKDGPVPSGVAADPSLMKAYIAKAGYKITDDDAVLFQTVFDNPPVPGCHDTFLDRDIEPLEKGST
jgi:hypothetical protein